MSALRILFDPRRAKSDNPSDPDSEHNQLLKQLDHFNHFLNAANYPNSHPLRALIGKLFTALREDIFVRNRPTEAAVFAQLEKLKADFDAALIRSASSGKVEPQLQRPGPSDVSHRPQTSDENRKLTRKEIEALLTKLACSP